MEFGLGLKLGNGGGGGGICVCFPPTAFEHFIPGLKADAIIANIEANDNKTLFK